MGRAVVFCSVVTAALVVTTATPAGDSSQILSKYFGFSARDIQDVERGEVVAESLAADSSEVAIAAAALIKIPVSYYLERFEKIESFKRSEEVLQIARFSTPPSPAELQMLTLDSGDIEALRKCRPGDCDVKLDEAGITRVRGVDVLPAYRGHLAEYVARYVREGNAALMVYNDQKKRALADELRQILSRSPYLQKEWPAMASTIRDFRGSLQGDLRQFLYWSKEKPPGKAVVSITHAIIQPETNGTAVVATKQLYASHYMTGSLGLTMLVNRDTPAGPATLLIYVNRTRVDLFDGVLGKVKRPIVRSRARGGAERMLGRLRTRLESDFGTRR